MTEERDLTVPNLLFCKVESSGLYRNDLQPEDNGQPFALEIAGMLCNSRGAITNVFSHVIRPDGRIPQANALRIHGISDRAASQVGIAESRVMGMLSDLLRTPVVTGMKVVSYTEFDPRVISSMFARFAVSQGKGANVYDKLWKTRPLIEFVTLQDPWCTQACKIPVEDGDGDYRRPTIDEAAEIMLAKPKRNALREAIRKLVDTRSIDDVLNLFDPEPKREGFHDALSGMQKLQRIYFELRSKGMFEEESV